jgi:hypothetical protein
MGSLNVVKKTRAKNSHAWAHLKVHKRDKFFGSDFEFFTIL